MDPAVTSTQNAITKKARRTKSPLFTSETEKRNLVWLLRAPKQGTGSVEEESLSLNLHRKKIRIARVL